MHNEKTRRFEENILLQLLKIELISSLAIPSNE